MAAHVFGEYTTSMFDPLGGSGSYGVPILMIRSGEGAVGHEVRKLKCGGCNHL